MVLLRNKYGLYGLRNGTEWGCYRSGGREISVTPYGVWGWRADTRREKESGKGQQHGRSTKGSKGDDGDDALLRRDGELVAGHPIICSLVLQVTHGRRRSSYSSSTIQSLGVLSDMGW